VPNWWKRSDRGEAVTLLAASAWWLRAAVFVIVAAGMLSAHGSIAAGIAELAIAAAALIGWWASDRLSSAGVKAWLLRLVRRGAQQAPRRATRQPKQSSEPATQRAVAPAQIQGHVAWAGHECFVLVPAWAGLSQRRPFACADPARSRRRWTIGSPNRSHAVRGDRGAPARRTTVASNWPRHT
jgi:hypothetical protein